MSIKNKSFINLLSKILIILVITNFSCSAITNKEKVNSLLKEIFTEDSNLKNQEQSIKDEIYQRIKLAREHNYNDNCHENSTLNNQKIFQKIYSDNFKSNTNQQMNANKNIIEKLPDLLKKYNIKSILDAPCGDYSWMQNVNRDDIKYEGIDIISEVIDKNNKNFKNENTSFSLMDITSSKIPKADLIICRNCLEYLSYENIKKIIENFKNSGSKYLLVTNYSWTIDNYNTEEGNFRTLNLCQKPFNLPKPIEKISDTYENNPDKYLYLYNLENININNENTEETPSTIPIAMALDENYLYPTLVSITSAMENSSNNSLYEFYIMHSPKFSKKSKNVLKSLEKKYNKCKINLINMKNAFETAHSSSRFTVPAYYRLMLSELIPNFDKAIWMDADTIIYKDLKEMFNVDMEGYCYKGLLDYSSHNDFTKNVFGIDSDSYICSGVMLVNLKELRKENAIDKFNNFISKNNKKLRKHDQTVINTVFPDKIGVLPAKFCIWNHLNGERAMSYLTNLPCPDKYTPTELSNASSNPTVLHCVRKPWNIPNINKSGEDWWNYAEKTDYFNNIKEKYLIPDGIYTIASDLNKNKVLDIPKNSNKQKTKLQLWSRNNSNAQKFVVTYQKGGYYTIKALCSGKLIDVPGSSTEKCTQLWQYDKNNTDAQKWYIIRNKNGSHKIISKCNGMNVDVKNAKTSNGTPIQCHPSNRTKAQNFRFIKTKKQNRKTNQKNLKIRRIRRTRKNRK